MSNHVKFLCLLLCFLRCNFCVFLQSFVSVDNFCLFVGALIIQQWYQSYDWEHTKVRDTVV